MARQVADDGRRNVSDGGDLRLVERTIAEQTGEQQEGRARIGHGCNPSETTGAAGCDCFAPPCYVVKVWCALTKRFDFQA